jgi:hypothetical protein
MRRWSGRNRLRSSLQEVIPAFPSLRQSAPQGWAPFSTLSRRVRDPAWNSVGQAVVIEADYAGYVPCAVFQLPEHDGLRLAAPTGVGIVRMGKAMNAYLDGAEAFYGEISSVPGTSSRWTLPHMLVLMAARKGWRPTASPV